MDFKKIAAKAKQVVDNRGGVDSLKQDAEQLRDIAKGQGSITDKAKEAVAAVKDPGDEGELAGTPADPTAQAAPVATPAQPPAASEPAAAPQDPIADELPEGERHGGGGHGRHSGHGHGHGGQGRNRGADEQV